MKEFLYRNPWVRTFLPLSLLTVASITANALVAEIAKGTVIDWAAIPKKFSFYVLLFATILTALYQVLLYKFDKSIPRGLTSKQYEAALRNQVLEESAKKVKELIQEGDLEKLEKATETFMKLFGES